MMINRFTSLVLSTCCLLLFGVCATTAWAAKPNVIIVMTDDQGYPELSIHGNPILKTPHLDRLHDHSLRLADYHVSPMCAPTRGQLLTGLDAARNGAINVSSGRALLRPEIPTMGDFFERAGYATGIFGKWHLGANYPFRPEDRGFSETVWFPSSHIGSVPDFWGNDYFDDTYIRNGMPEAFEGYCTDVFFEEAMAFMARSAKAGLDSARRWGNGAWTLLLHAACHALDSRAHLPMKNALRLLTLALLAPSAAAGGLALFKGMPGSVGDVMVVLPTGGSYVPAGLDGIRLFDGGGR